MQVTRRTLLSSIAAAGVSLTFVGSATAADGSAQYIVTVRTDAVHRRLEAAGFDVSRSMADGTVLDVTGPANAVDDLASIAGVVAAAENPMFEVEVPEAVAEADADAVESTQSLPIFVENQWDKLVTDTLEAHDHATGTGSTVAIIDTGIDPDHPDLVDNIVEMEFFTSLDALDLDPYDYNGHGTNVAGIAAASGAVGVIGTAPDADIVSLKVFHIIVDEETGELVLATTTADILAAIDYAAEIGADAANLSLGTQPIPPEGNAGGIRTGYEFVFQHAIRRGTLISASAGNSAANLQQGGYFTLPNSTAGATSISATAPDDGLSFYSNFGTNEIDVGAPGGGYDNLIDTLVGYQEWLEAGLPPHILLDPREEGELGTLWLDVDGIPTTDPDAVVDAEAHPMPA